MHSLGEQLGLQTWPPYTGDARHVETDPWCNLETGACRILRLGTQNGLTGLGLKLGSGDALVMLFLAVNMLSISKLSNISVPGGLICLVKLPFPVRLLKLPTGEWSSCSTSVLLCPWRELLHGSHKARSWQCAASLSAMRNQAANCDSRQASSCSTGLVFV